MKKIVRELHVSRNTVRKILRTDETDFSYERSRQPQPRIGPWQDQLEQLLSSNAGKPSRERLTLIRIFEELRGLGYEGGYDAVRRFAKSWSQNRGAVTAEAYVPLYYAPGEAYQFDWSHEIIVISGVTVTVKVAHVRLCHSRMMFARAYMRESQEMVFDAHDRAFAFFKGTCTRGIYDNMKTAVEAIFIGKERHYNRRFLQMCSHYLVQPVACTPASGWEKGQVENQVGLVRERFFTPRLRVKSLDELNAWLLDKCVADAKAHRHPEESDKTIWEMFEAERPQLVPYVGPFDGFHSVPASVSKARAATSRPGPTPALPAGQAHRPRPPRDRRSPAHRGLAAEHPDPRRGSPAASGRNPLPAALQPRCAAWPRPSRQVRSACCRQCGRPRRSASSRWLSRITGTSVSPSKVAASTRPCPAISSPSSATMQGTVQPNFAMLAAIFATWSSAWILALRA